ncbi:hypothetical protein BST97_15390 [Nonlabens spongiae]|uniref:Uncharacterized protein n=2 Tax=Nonlabens spongiae TaxID=331648 RepID=A0A1W6MP70_9FLAO|nr:hypothetical protein BST97_15390 [Nonlabens spongiae]
MFSQNPKLIKQVERDVKEIHEKIKTLHVAHITAELELTESEAQEFWPVYNKMREEDRQIDHEKRDLMREIDRNYSSMTNAQAKSYLEKYKALERREAAAEFSEYHERIIDIVGIKRFFKLKKADYDFRRKMLRKFKSKRDKRTGFINDRIQEHKLEAQKRRDLLMEKRDSLKVVRES